MVQHQCHSVHDIQQFYIGSFTVMSINTIKSSWTDISSSSSSYVSFFFIGNIGTTKIFEAFQMREYGYQFIPRAIKRTFLMRCMNKIMGAQKHFQCLFLIIMFFDHDFKSTRKFSWYSYSNLWLCWNIEFFLSKI